MSDLQAPIGEPFEGEGNEHEMTHLWVISYSDFMTILMIFFLMLFAHRVWEKRVSWEAEKVKQLRAAQEVQKGMIQRLTRMADVEVQSERINIHLPDALLFDAGRAGLRDSAKTLLARLVLELVHFNGDVVVEGHTDNQPVGSHSGFRSNWELSVARAFSVIQCFAEKGIPPERISARGYGEYRPRVLNDTPEHRAENRRIEIVLLNPRKGS